MKKFGTVKKLDVTSVFCDKCNKEIVDAFDYMNNPSVNYTFGYLSKRDGENIKLDFCEDCFETILGKELMKKGLENSKSEYEEKSKSE